MLNLKVKCKFKNGLKEDVIKEGILVDVKEGSVFDGSRRFTVFNPKAVVISSDGDILFLDIEDVKVLR